jgi:hypothetical protein
MTSTAKVRWVAISFRAGWTFSTRVNLDMWLASSYPRNLPATKANNYVILKNKLSMRKLLVGTWNMNLLSMMTQMIHINKIRALWLGGGETGRVQPREYKLLSFRSWKALLNSAVEAGEPWLGYFLSCLLNSPIGAGELGLVFLVSCLNLSLLCRQSSSILW